MSCSRAARDRRGPPSPPIGRRPSPVRATALAVGRRLHPATAPWKIINNRVKCGAGRGREAGGGVAGWRVSRVPVGVVGAVPVRSVWVPTPPLPRRGLGRAWPGLVPGGGGPGGLGWAPGRACCATGCRPGPGVSAGRQALAGVRLAGAGERPLVRGVFGGGAPVQPPASPARAPSREAARSGCGRASGGGRKAFPEGAATPPVPLLPKLRRSPSLEGTRRPCVRQREGKGAGVCLAAGCRVPSA